MTKKKLSPFPTFTNFWDFTKMFALLIMELGVKQGKSFVECDVDDPNMS